MNVLVCWILERMYFEVMENRNVVYYDDNVDMGDYLQMYVVNS